MKAADAIAQWLADKGITTGFGIVGGGNVVLWDAIHRLGKTSLICTHHEQAATMAASYYARASGGPGFALVTTGAGSGNAITGVIAAWMDGTPLLVISGNEASTAMGSECRVWGVQGYASAEVVQKITKCSKRSMWPGAARATLEEALTTALAAPQGPVWIDIPKDVQSAEI